LSGNKLTYGNGTITTLSGNTLDYNSGTVDTLSGNKLTYGNGTITTLSGDTLDYNSGTVDTLRGNTLDYNSGTVDTLSGDKLTYDNGTITTLSGDTLDYNSGTVDTFRAVSFNADTASVSNFSSSKANITELIVGSADVTDLSAENANLDNVESDDISANEFTSGNVEAGSGSVSGNTSAGSVSASNLTVNNRLQTNVIVSNSSSVGDGSTSNLTVLETLSASGINLTTANFETGNIDSISGTNANYNSVTGNHFSGGSFTSDDDFHTSQSTVNNNYDLITEQRNKLNHCVDVTKYCLPETPSVNVTCSSCNSAASRTSFSGTAIGSISGCRQGCSYNWETTGNGLSFTGCSSGTISKGGSATPSCRVSSSLGPQESASGSIKLVVTNSHYTDRTASDSVSVSYRNTAPAFDLANISSYDCSVSEGSGCKASQTVSSGYGKNGASAWVNIFPTVNGFSPTEWASSDCPNCSWTYSVTKNECNWRQAGSPTNRTSSANESSAVDGVKFSFTVADGDLNDFSTAYCSIDVRFTVTDADTGQSTVVDGSGSIALETM
jgi:hypothetical protein